MKSQLPETIETIAELEEVMTRPSRELVDTLSQTEGDLMILGVGGKMGPTLARLARRAFDLTGVSRRVIGVSRFSHLQPRKDLAEAGVETIVCDLVRRNQVERLPETPNIVFMAGMKFGATGAQSMTWAMNVLVPTYVAERFRDSRIVAFSSGNVYPLTPVDSGGPTEEAEPAPIGEYAQSVLGRERIFEHFSRTQGTPVAIARLNYAIDLRYGVLCDIAAKVWNEEAIDLAMGYVNVIWQGDANRQILECLAHCATPPAVFNVAGPEILSVRTLAEELGTILGKAPQFLGSEQPTALLSNAAKANSLFGPPTVSIQTLLRWTAEWIRAGNPTLNKPTHFQTRDGKF